MQLSVHSVRGTTISKEVRYSIQHLNDVHRIDLINNEAKMAGSVVLLLLFLGLTLSQETKKEPIVLRDSTFEHLTQASTGATTGDWLVLL